MSFQQLLEKRKVIRAAPNPMDKATIVSIFPKEIIEEKVTLQPSRYVIPLGSYENPGILIVGTASWWFDPDPERPPLEIPQSSTTVAHSIVRDYSNGILESNMSNAQPGLFFIPGEHNLESIKKNYQHMLDEANVKQREWYRLLVKVGDSLWARTNGNPLAIDDMMKLAARELNQQRDWLLQSQSTELITCKACTSLVKSTAVICPNCKVVLNELKAKELGLKFAS